MDYAIRRLNIYSSNSLHLLLFKLLTFEQWLHLPSLNRVFFLFKYLVSIPLKMFRLWAFMGMMAQVGLTTLPFCLLRVNKLFTVSHEFWVSGPSGYVCGSLFKGELRQCSSLDLADHRSAYRCAYVCPWLLRASLWRRHWNSGDLMFPK